MSKGKGKKNKTTIYTSKKKKQVAGINCVILVVAMILAPLMAAFV